MGKMGTGMGKEQKTEVILFDLLGHTFGDFGAR
jgi:hypothetical protein